MTVNLFQISQDKGAKFIPRISGETFPAPKNSTFDIVASGGKIGSVQYFWNGTKLPLENRPPWRANGDAGTLKFKDGTNKLEATVYELSQGKGKVLLKTTWVFNCPAVQAPDGIVQKLAVKGGVCYLSDPIAPAMSIFNDCGITAIRAWDGSFGGRAKNDSDEVRAWKAAGIKRIVLTATPSTNQSKPPSLSDIKQWAKDFRKAYEGSGLDAVQVINECNLTLGASTVYWAGTIKEAADACAVVADELQGSGIDVYAPSISRNTTALKELVATGIGSRVQAFCFHSYGKDGDEHINGYKPDPKLKGVKGAAEIVGNHKLVITEFGLHAGSFSGWRTEIEKAWLGIKPYVSEAYCYRLVANQQPAGRFGLVTDKALKIKNTETYSQWQGLKV